MRWGISWSTLRIPNFSIPDKEAGMVFDPGRIHIYADSRLVEGAA